jgi:hypothetical protein
MADIFRGGTNVPRNILVAAGFALMATCVSGCETAQSTTRYALVPVWTNGQDVPGLDSRTTLESRQPGGIVFIRADDQIAGFGASFVVGVQNKSGAALEFSPGDIKASVNGMALPVLAAKEFSAEMEGPMRGFIKATIRMDRQDIDAASQETNRNYRFNNYGGCPAGQGGCQIFSDDNGSDYRQDRIDRQLDADTVATAAAQLQATRGWISLRALRPLRVAPGEMSGGIFTVKLPPTGGRVDLRITFNGSDHAFAFLASALATPAARP